MDIEKLRLAGKIHKEVEEYIRPHVQPNKTLLELCKIIENKIKSLTNKYSSNYQLNNGSWKIDFKDIQKIQKVNVSLFSKGNIKEKIEPLYDIVNDTSLVVHNANNTYDVLEFDLMTLNGKTFVLIPVSFLSSIYST